MIKLLLIEDDESQSYLIKTHLEQIIGGYKVMLALNGKEGLEILAKNTPEIIVADIMMPVMDGIEMVGKIRLTNKDIPVIFATAKTSSTEVTKGYSAGVNNYIKKPYYPVELDAHIRALLKLTSHQPDKINETFYQIGKYIFNSKFHYLEYQSQHRQLTPLESNILTLLCENMGDMVVREDILNKYWEPKHHFKTKSRNLDVHISRLRKYLSKDPSVSIANVKKTGLILKVE